MPADTSTPTFHPISQTERIHILDILRGFAMFGILVVNIDGFASPIFFPGYVSSPMSHYDSLGYSLMLFLAEGKFYVIFSFLFGLGFSVQLARSQAKGRDIRSFYPRRLWVLFGLGVVHAALFWPGEILRLYALLGFALLVFRQRSNRTLLIWSIAFLLLSGFFSVWQDFARSQIDLFLGADLVNQAQQIYSGGTFFDVVIFQTKSLPNTFIMVASWQALSVMGLFLLGLLAGRSQFFERLSEHRTTLVWMALGGLLLGLPSNWFYTFYINPWIESFGVVIGGPLLAAAYIGGLSLISLTPLGAKMLAPLGQVGRMALSNYFFQSLVCSLIFNAYGLGFYEKVGTIQLWGIAILIYLVQIPLSVWWLRRFHFGPLEWVWRSLTYGQRQPFRRVEPVK